MQHQRSASTHSAKEQSSHNKENSFSPATIKVAERALKEFERQSDEDFLARAEIDRKLSSF